MKKIKNFIRNNEAATAIEYGLIAALIAVAAIAGLQMIGPQLDKTFTKVGNSLTEANK